jgi:hypothetical protein
MSASRPGDDDREHEQREKVTRAYRKMIHAAPKNAMQMMAKNINPVAVNTLPPVRSEKGRPLVRAAPSEHRLVL